MCSELMALVGAADERASDAWKASKVHGDLHSRQVARLGHWLPRVIPGAAEADPAVVFAFAVLHDSQRAHDGTDPDHGRRAAKVAKSMRRGGALDLTGGQADALSYALKHHAEGETSPDPTIGTCWDADRLALLRMQIRPKMNRLSTIHTRAELTAAVTAGRVTVSARDLPWEDVLSKSRPGLVLYHGTSATHGSSILRDGLREGRPGRGVYFSPSREIARDYFIRSALREHQLTRTLPDRGLLIHAQFGPDLEFASHDEGVYGFCVPRPVVTPAHFSQVEELDFRQEMRHLQAKRRAAREARKAA
jgi:uncharacterized protein